jgi:tetratricopeptide (TPR) repeat protein
MKHDRMHTEAGDVLERALFAFGRAVHSTFANAIAAGKAHLSFNRPENREFFLACWRYIQDLSMRSTWRTAYEWMKLLFSLEPNLDPYCLSLIMDQYALRANQAEHYLKLFETGIFKFQSENLWHMLYSIALCHLRLSRHEDARSTLRNAIEHDRYTGHQLCKLLDISPVPASLWGHHEAPDSKIQLFSGMYTARAKDLWNSPEAKSLLESSAKELPKSAPLVSTTTPWVTVEAARHVYLTENDGFMRLLAQCQVENGAEAGDRPTQDPFPPESEIRSYDPRPSRNLGGVASGITALGRVPNEQMRMLMEELARMQMDGGRWEDEDSEDDGR